MQTIQTFNLGFGPTSRQAPTLPEPLDTAEFHTRQEIREHQNAVVAHYEYQRQAENQARIDADNKRAKELVEAQREQTDEEYDDMKRKLWQAEQDKWAASAAKEKEDELEKIAYLLSSPAIADIFTRSEFNCLQSVIHWAGRGYTMQDDGFLSFGNGIFHIQMTAPAAKTKASN